MAYDRAQAAKEAGRNRDLGAPPPPAGPVVAPPESTADAAPEAAAVVSPVLTAPAPPLAPSPAGAQPAATTTPRATPRTGVGAADNVVDLRDRSVRRRAVPEHELTANGNKLLGAAVDSGKWQLTCELPRAISDALRARADEGAEHGDVLIEALVEVGDEVIEHFTRVETKKFGFRVEAPKRRVRHTEESFNRTFRLSRPNIEAFSDLVAACGLEEYRPVIREALRRFLVDREQVRPA